MSCPSDSTFGPTVSRGCRGGFDFTLKFEDIVLSLIPSSLFIALAVARLRHLVYRTKPVYLARGSTNKSLRVVKVVIATAYSALQLAVLVRGKLMHNEAGTATTAAHALSLISSLLILPLTVLEDTRSRRPSFLLSVYLLFTSLFDAIRVRTQWLLGPEHTVLLAKLDMAAVAVKLLLLVLENFNKRAKAKAHDCSCSPEETAGPFSIATYVWLNPLFRKGYKNILSLDDLPPLEKRLVTETLHEKLSARLKGITSGLTPRFALAKALARTLLGSLLLPIIPRLALVGFRFSQPLLLNSLLNHLAADSYNNKNSDNDDGFAASAYRNASYGLIGATVFIYSGMAVSTAVYWYCQERFVSMTRGALVATIYEKLTQLKTTVNTINNNSNKNNNNNNNNKDSVVTLMSTDIERIRVGLWNLHEFWASCLEVALSSWLLYTHVGIAFVAPLVVVIVCVTCASVINIYTGPKQKKWMEGIEVRVADTAKMLASLKQLKISGLARPVEESTQQLRVTELDAASGFRRLYVTNMAFGFAPMALCPLVTFAVAAKDLDASTVFTSLSYIVLLADPLGILFGEIPYLVTAFTCLERIQDFITQEIQVDNRCFGAVNSSSSDDKKSGYENMPLVSLVNTSAGWENDNLVFQDINVHIPPSSLTMLIGPVGCGKSTLCRALLAEVPVTKGIISINSTLSRFKSALCEQTPYIYQGSIRDNIIGSLPFDTTRYSEVTSATLLEPDLKALPLGDATAVGSNGVTLSGGQKQRVAIARALYHQADFYVFDDSLSGLDADTELELFNRVFSPEGILRRRGATALLATHNIRLLPLATHIISLGPGGTMDYAGDYAGLVAAGLSGDIRENVKAEQRSQSEKHNIEHPKPSSNAEPEQVTKVEEVDAMTQQYDSFLSEKDRMTGDSTVYRYYLASLGKLSIIAFGVFGLGWGFFYNFGSVWLELWSADNTKHTSDIPNTSQRQQQQQQQQHSRAFCLGLYALWQTGGLASIVLCFWTSYTMMVRISGAKLHQSALRTIVNAPLSFLTTTDVGVITNLFSQDMTLVDNELPMAVTNLALDIFNALGMAGVIAASSAYVVVLYPFLAAVLWLLQKVYLRTARQLRLLDLEAKTPLYTQFLDTSRGLPTIRSFGWTSTKIKETISLLDSSQKPAYLLALVQRWLQFVLLCVVGVLAVVVVTLATQLHSPPSSQSGTQSRPQTAGFTGPSIVALMSFGDILNYIIRWWTQMETSVGAIARLKSLGDKVPHEDNMYRDNDDDDNSDNTIDSIPPEWPAYGQIEIKGVSASYQNPDIPNQQPPTSISEKPPHLVLKDLSVSIAAGEKVAICGRSGSGKSSLILLLLRMLDPVSSSLLLSQSPSSSSTTNNKTTNNTTNGANNSNNNDNNNDDGNNKILIDGITLSSISRAKARDRIIAMSQDPVFLPGEASIKKQLDPFDRCSAEECLAVLDLAGLAGKFGVTTTTATATITTTTVATPTAITATATITNPARSTSTFTSNSISNSIPTANEHNLEAKWHPDSLSGGQKQLFNLARTVLRGRIRAKSRLSSESNSVEKDDDNNNNNSKRNRNHHHNMKRINSGNENEHKHRKRGGILLLDEVSSSVDRETERVMQRIIMEEFGDYTIIMVAHHLDMVMDYDRVLVIDCGRVIEQGKPRLLVEQQTSSFNQLWMAAQSN